MNKQKRLLLGRNIFLFVIIICFAVIIVTEKTGDLFIPKVEKKMDTYLADNYNDIIDSLKEQKITYNSTVYKRKVISKENQNLYFYIIYSNKKITDTYKEDYEEGKSLLKKINKDLEKEIRNTINTNIKIDIISTLNDYTKIVQERIIKEDKLLELKFYTIKKEFIIENWNEKEITKEITNLINNCNKNNITPKSYTITITNKNDITESIEISGLDESFVINKSKEKIISDIINDNGSKLLKENKIKYKYLN